MKMWNKVKAFLQSEIELLKEGIKEELRQQQGNHAFLIVASPW